MHIALVSQYYPPEMGAAAARTREHARHWADAGHDVTVVTGFPDYPDGVIPDEYRGDLLRWETDEGVDVLRTWLYAARNAGFARRLLNYGSFTVSAALVGSAALDPPDVVVATSPQLLVGLSGAALSLRFDSPFVLDIRDLWPKSAVDLGALEHPIPIQIAETIESNLYRFADDVVIVSESFRDHVRERGVPDDRVHFVPNGIDPDFLEEREDVDVRSSYGFGDRFVVGYIGTHGMSQGLSTVLEAADRLRQRSDLSDVQFMFVGDGAEKPDLVEEAEERGLDQVEFVPIQPREAIPSFYEACDVCLVPLRDRPVFKTVLPSKMFEIMALGRPMVVAVGGEAERVVSEGEAGVCIPPESPGAMADAIEALHDDPERRKNLAERAEAYVWEHFSRPVLADRYLEILQAARARA
ncbi:MAG: glycosyltransferase family 4 protein [Bradymonadaceae bacterium]